MWLDQTELSCFSYYECLEIHNNNIEIPIELKDLITDSNYALKYCMNIEDDPDVRKHITNTKDIYDYCLKVKMRIEMIDKMDKKHWWYKLLEKHGKTGKKPYKKLSDQLEQAGLSKIPTKKPTK